MYEYELPFFQQTSLNVRDCLKQLRARCPLIIGFGHKKPEPARNSRAMTPSHIVKLRFNDEAAAKITMCGPLAQESYLVAAVGDVPVRDSDVRGVNLRVVEDLPL